jgi:hypothetical protein
MILINIAVFLMQKEQKLGQNSHFFSNALEPVQRHKNALIFKNQLKLRKI